MTTKTIANSQGIRDNYGRGKVADFLAKKISDNSVLSVVSAYFTIYAYEALADRLDRVETLRFLFGEPRFISTLDPEKTDKKSFKIEDEGLELSNRLQQKEIARRCAKWIRDKVEIRSIRQSNLLHGKLYHIHDGHREHAILGSSNFTLRGLGLAATPNIELNLVVDSDRDRADLKAWFDEIWTDDKLVADVKDEVLRYLSQLYVNHSPEFIYFKTLFHVFERFLTGQAHDAQLFDRTAIVDTDIWKALFDFQKDGAKGAIHKINSHNGCILADSVGLGKTYTALAVIKYHELRNLRVLVLCPKKLRDNWTVFLAQNNSELNPFLKDRFAYTVLSHTDLSRETGKVDGVDLATLNWGNFDLIVIDESHNFRNNVKGKRDEEGNVIRKSRYERLMQDIIQTGVKTKVMLLSATRCAPDRGSRLKLQTFTLCDFHAFPGPGEYTFDFGNKDHLLIYGENGSGKTSVFKSLVEFFDLRNDALPFRQHKNFFSGDTLTCGKVELKFREAGLPPSTTPIDTIKIWSFSPEGSPDNRMRGDQTVQQVGRRKGLLDYQALVKANFSALNESGRMERPNLFQLMVTDLLYNLEVVQPGGMVSTIGKLWLNFQQTLANNQYFRGNALVRIQSAQETFNNAMRLALPRLKNRADALLSNYFSHPVELSFLFIDAIFHRHRRPGSRTVKNGSLFFDLKFRGRSFDKYEEVLNEAKLSAVALCVYFAALLEGIPKGTSGYPRVLVLDDVLIGLDMQNRLPVLNILRDEFSADGWQIIILTHDKVWYDYASHAASGLDWACHELYADLMPDGAGGWDDLPFLRTPEQGAGDYLQRAREQMLLHDHKAAAMYARAAYE